MRYPGGKGKCYQRLINLMPPHTVYIEAHLGGGAVMRHKKPAVQSIGIDADLRVIQSWQTSDPDLCTLVHDDAVRYLMQYPFQGSELVYCDPPYLASVRRRAKIYRHEYDVEQHRQLLAVLVSLPCMVMISGYDSPMYREALRGWRLETFDAKTHVDVRQECVWCNFEAPRELHDASHFGETFRDRQTIKRRQDRLIAKFDRMDPIERNSMLALLSSKYQRDVQPV